MAKKTKFIDRFSEDDLGLAQEAVEDLYGATEGFIVIANGSKKKIFARFHNMSSQDIEYVLKSLGDKKEKPKVLVPDKKIIT